MIFTISLLLLYASSHFVVKYGTDLALGLMLPPIFVGLFFLALGTSLPELVFTVKAMTQNHAEFAIGDLIGSVVMNSTLVLAVAALIFPITVNIFLFLTSALFMILAAVLFATFVRSGKKFTYLEGISLLILYILFIIVELNVQQYFV
jgi:cation:H+ antiporter